ncbi:unnamed protein product [Peniophora sp. CBMAI 1063]|nr:unnamed protein product [Peniophora sp. CBMAI 1063]
MQSAPELNDAPAQCIANPPTSLLDRAPAQSTLTVSTSTPPVSSRAHSMPSIPRHARSRPSLTHASSSSLDSIEEDVPLCLTTRSASRAPASSSGSRSASSQRRKSAALKESCGICFESTAMRNPDVARCCLQMFCHEHLADWLKRDSRCPACGEPLTLERGTVALRAPTRTAKPPALESGRLTARPRSRNGTTFLIAPSSAGGTSSSSDGSGSDGEERGSRRCRTSLQMVVVRPQYSSLNELAAELLPLRAVGVLLSLTGCALMVSVVLA